MLLLLDVYSERAELNCVGEHNLPLITYKFTEWLPLIHEALQLRCSDNCVRVTIHLRDRDSYDHDGTFSMDPRALNTRDGG